MIKMNDLEVGDYFIGSVPMSTHTLVSIFMCAFSVGNAKFMVIDLRESMHTWTLDWDTTNWTVIKKVNNPFNTDNINEILEGYR